MHRQMHLIHQFWVRRIGIDQALGEFLGMRGGVAYALDAGNFGDVFEQQREIGGFIFSGCAIGIDVLPQLGDFINPLQREFGHFGQHAIEGA